MWTRTEKKRKLLLCALDWDCLPKRQHLAGGIRSESLRLIRRRGGSGVAVESNGTKDANSAKVPQLAMTWTDRLVILFRRLLTGMAL